MAREQIILNTFGLKLVKPLVYSLRIGDPLSQNSSEFTDQDIDVSTRLNSGADDQEVRSVLDTPVFSDLILQYDSSGLYLKVDTVLFNVSQSKNIITTSVAGRNGTIKEYISDGDYVIDIKGLIVSSDATAYPTEQVQEFISLMKVQSDIPVISPFLQLFEIYNIVITSYRVPQVEGFQNVQPFEISCISDVPLELNEET